MAATAMTIIENGPFIVTSNAELKDTTGNNYPAAEKLAFCRCGASTNKPFCDGTHGKIGVAVAKQAATGSAGS